MNPMLLAGTAIVHLALIFYTIGIVSQHRHRRIDRKVITFLTLGVIFDISATGCMAIGSQNNLFTLHGMVGISALSAMLTHTILARRHQLVSPGQDVPRWLQSYSRVAYLWWVLAFISGATLAVLRRM